MLQVIINLISGLAGGNAAGSLLKKLSLGPIGNSIVGLIGGWLGGTGLSSITNAASGSMDAGSIISSIAGGAGGGAILTAIVGFIKSKMGK